MSELNMLRPEATEYGAYFGKYIQLPPDGDILGFLESQLSDLLSLLRGMSEQDSLVHHAPYTWSTKQVVGHISDSERVFAHRALWIARKSPTPLSSFDENAFMEAANFDRWPLGEILGEFELVRKSTLSLFRHFEPEVWLRRGIVNEQPTSVRAHAYVIGGHAKHHLVILHKRLAGR